MSQRILWKLVLTGAILAWALYNLIPYSDRPFDQYTQEKVTASKATALGKLLERAKERHKADPKATPSVFMGLKQIVHEEQVDLSEFFPDARLDASLKSKDQKNEALLNHLLAQSRARLKLGLDLSGGVSFTLESPTIQSGVTGEYEQKQKLEKAVEIIEKRVNGLGVAEPVIRPVGTNRIEVQLPAVSTKDNPDIDDVLKKPARLEFRMVLPQTGPMTSIPPQVPPGYVTMRAEEPGPSGETLYYIVRQLPAIVGEDIEDARYGIDPMGKPEVQMTFTERGTKRFAEATTAHVGNLMAIVLDGVLKSAPVIKVPITNGRGVISGNYTPLEADKLANNLNNPLEDPLNVTEQYEVGPTLAQDALASGKLSFYISTALTIAFILFFYTFGGIVAAVGMAANVFVILGVMAYFGATLTMPGIAGIVLTLAMSVDSNILIFERMREELTAGKSLPVALEAGFEKAWSAIIDSNLTTLITAVLMIICGTGPVKGFGVTLTIGIFTTMFAALIVSKLLLEVLILPGHMRKLPMFSVLQNTKYEFLKFAKPSFIVSWAIVLLGACVLVYKGDAIYGVDFAGGDQMTISYKQRVEIEKLRDAVKPTGIREATFAYQTQLGSGQEVLKVTTGFDEGGKLVAALQEAFPSAGFVNAGQTRIGPSVGDEIQWSAVKALTFALLGILIYVAFRFEFGYGVGAIVATIHDLFMTVGIFVLFDRQFNASMVAAILLVAGYSINDTIVVFDRIREELKLNPNGTLRDIINRALNLTLSRTIITGGTTLLTAITLLIVTQGEVNDIAFTLLIGVITGTFSSLYIAAPVFYWWHKGDRRHVEEHKDLAPKYEWVGASKASR